MSKTIPFCIVGRTSALVALMVLASTPVVAKDAKSPERAVAGAGKTAYLDISIMSRKKRAADKLTALHDAHFKLGWKVIDVDPYIENGDLQGFYITYVGMEH